MSEADSVIVVGGGVAGLCAAYYLARGGAQVSVVESNRIGCAASAGNGGWLCPAQAGPLPEPGLTLMGMRALLNHDSSLYFKPSTLPQLSPWLLRFRSYCNSDAYSAGVRALARLGGRVFGLVEEMVQHGVDFELHRQGMLIAASDPDAARGELDKLKPMREFGYEIPDRVLLDDELREAEPALAAGIRAGFVVPQHWHVRPETFNDGVAAALRDMGVEILEGAEVFDIKPDGAGPVTLRTAAGDKQAGSVVLAAGSWTPKLAALVGARVPVQAGKGYSFMVTPSVMPRHAILLADVHVGCTPFAEGMRIGGTMEFSGLNLNLDRRRIDATVDGARSSFLDWSEPAVRHEWAGLRPIAPDGLPVIDRVRDAQRVFVATGYSMQGMTLGPPAGEAIAEYVLTDRRPPQLEPFALDRFGRIPWPGRRNHGWEKDGA